MSELPPVLQLLENEIFSDASSNDFFQDIRELIPELRKQAEWSASNHEYIDDKALPKNKLFAVSPVSGINPFGDNGKCSELNCRVKVAENFSRTIGLYSDVIYLPDPLTTWFLDDEKLQWTDDGIISLLNEVIVLKTLSPLIKSGVIEFISPVKSMCTSCYGKLEEQIYDFTDQAISELWEEISVVNSKNYLTINTGMLHEPNLSLVKYFDPTIKNKKSKAKIARELFFNIVSDDIHEHLYTMHEASTMNSTILSNSRVGLRSLKNLEGHDPKAFKPIDWEKSRTADLPLIKDLTPTQIVELRDSASKALPQFRELMYKNTVLGNQDTDNRTECTDLILELRGQAIEVKAELDSINVASEINFHNTGGMIGLSIALYSSAIGNPVMGLTTLMATLGLIHTTLKKDNAEVEKLKTKPGYVLIKAQEILKTHN